MIDINKLRQAIKDNPNIDTRELEEMAYVEDSEETEEPSSVAFAVSEDTQEVVENSELNTAPVESAAVVVANKQPKSITEVTLNDVKVAINTSKSAGEQVEEVIDYAATVAAVNDKGTVDQISNAKKEEIVAKAEVKAKDAKKDSVKADTEVQKAKRAKFELLFDTFGVADHIPDWLLKILMCIFAPFYVIFVIAIGIPTGFIRFLIDCVDGILVRYDEADQARKPKIKVTVWVVLALIITAAICLTFLKCFNVI